MKNDKKKKIIVSALIAGLIGLSLGFGEEAQAWGPERTTYTNENPAPGAVFNSITNNAAVGDERNFVRIVQVSKDGTKGEYVNEVDVTGGNDYEVSIYYHNNASETYNKKEYDYKGIAWETKISAAFPQSLSAGEKGEVNAIISADNTLVKKVWDEAFLNAKEDVNLAYIAGSAKIYNGFATSGSVISASMDLLPEKYSRAGLPLIVISPLPL